MVVFSPHCFYLTEWKTGWSCFSLITQNSFIWVISCFINENSQFGSITHNPLQPRLKSIAPVLICCCSWSESFSILDFEGCWCSSSGCFLHVCCFLVCFCVSGGFAGDGHSVSSGQQTAGEIQDAGWNRWAASLYFFKTILKSEKKQYKDFKLL